MSWLTTYAVAFALACLASAGLLARAWRGRGTWVAALLPLAVLAHGGVFDIRLPEILARYGITSAEYEASLRANYESLATLVPQARFFVAAESAHDIHQDQPELVIEAIRQVVEGVRHPDTWDDLTSCCTT